ncbi:uracil-DNA glycosylase family protein [Novosphingobium sp. P6W]|uniref:uracil-DNA glycosylase family protein n=1 Tax=Novosphingobium sp. P6W TaxID=1609758 RepID=UPI0005C2DDCA|nr:uracil-DNA glycosylase family protein [Novosphingobium sp. P6W]AXB75785.1 uracil-DNA glycosylase family protein [Novosphingobium sp. P6W]KIS33007.1 IclR family transcriptional regulator [Novosphingobium sp. P6W]
MATALDTLLGEIRACRLCEHDLGFEPRPFVAAQASARMLIIGQAPGSKVHASGIGWDDDSGDRLRGWLGLDKEAFYDAGRIAQMPSGFCYPGKASGGDKPPRPECAPRWHGPLLAQLPNLKLTLLVGQYAQKRYLPKRFAPNLTEAVRNWREAPEGLIPLPHPAWRSRLWMAKHPWFEAELLPALRERVGSALAQNV